MKMSNNVCIIRNSPSGLILEAQDSSVKVQFYDGFPSQKWRAEVVSIPRCLIIASNDEVLDVEGEGDATAKAKVITSVKRGCNGDSKQHWIINSDNTIANASAPNLVLDIKENKLIGGNDVIVFTRSGDANQTFELLCPNK